MIRCILRLISCLLGLVLIAGSAQAQRKGSPPPPATVTNDHFDFISINNVLMWMSNNGCMSHDPRTDGSGCEWPVSSGKHVIFAEGLVFGGTVSGEVRVGGATYRNGLQAGKILPTGVAADPSDPRYRIYKARKMNAADYALLSSADQQRIKEDFLRWPVEDGAPWTDKNSNGVYEPDFYDWLNLGDNSTSDTPWFIGDEVLWFVSNDMDASRTSNLYGSAPMRIEIQTLVWAYKSGGPLANSVFVKHKLINRSTSNIDNFYIAKWSDPDIGDGYDDCIGMDTALQCGFAYNGRSHDAIYPDPPAAGYVLLQTPVVPASPADTARVNFGTRAGFRNLSLSTFNFWVNTVAPYLDPTLGSPVGAQELYNNFRGLTSAGNSLIDPVTGKSTKITLAGDPITRTGWVDGVYLLPDDRRFLMVNGPLQFARGDTQEVVYALVVSQGSTNIRSVAALRDDARLVRLSFSQMPLVRRIPTVTCDVSYPGPNAARISIDAIVPEAISVSGVLRRGAGPDLSLFALYDDGLHRDGAAGDGIFGGDWDTTRLLEGVDCYIRARYSGGNPVDWPAGACIPLAGPVHTTLHAIESDHLNYDHEANPGENIRFSVDLANQTPFTIGQWRIVDNGFGTTPPGRIVLPDAIAPSGVSFRAYDASNPDTYLSFDVPASAQTGSGIYLPLLIFDSHNNCWRDSVLVQVKAPATQPVDYPAVHAEGPCTGNYRWRIVDRNALQNHTYKITIEGADSAVQRYATIQDLNSRQTLVSQQPLPDMYAHEFPTVDGWRLVGGYLLSYPWDENRMTEQYTSADYIPANHEWLYSYFYTNDGFVPGEMFLGSRLTMFDAVPVKLVFDRNRTQKAYNYLRGAVPNFGCVGYFDIPVQAFDMSDSAHPRQINLAFVEQKNSAANDNTWMPTTTGSDREYLFVLESDYSPTAQPEYLDKKINVDAVDMDILYGGWFVKYSSSSTFQDGDYFMIRQVITVSNRDVFYINPLGPVNGIRKETIPDAISLGANYPNPFGAAATTIPFDLPSRTHATLKVYDALGRLAATLLDETLNAGYHERTFKPAPRLRSGCYTAELTAGGIRKTIRMLLIK
jgi:hypothetical protein